MVSVVSKFRLDFRYEIRTAVVQRRAILSCPSSYGEAEHRSLLRNQEMGTGRRFVFSEPTSLPISGLRAHRVGIPNLEHSQGALAYGADFC
jgi:hypothetical protein